MQVCVCVSSRAHTHTHKYIYIYIYIYIYVRYKVYVVSHTGIRSHQPRSTHNAAPAPTGSAPHHTEGRRISAGDNLLTIHENGQTGQHSRQVGVVDCINIAGYSATYRTAVYTVYSVCSMYTIVCSTYYVLCIMYTECTL